MKLLIIGGTVFLGRAVVEFALAQGHEVTLFNRGQSNTDLFPEIEQIHGNRDGGLEALAGRTFDACLDTCGYVPRIVNAAAQFLKDAVKHYAFVSSVSVYGEPSPEGVDESGVLATMDDPSIEEITGESYGPLKALCEAEVSAAFGDRALLIRPGLIVGPHDVSDRFTYWPWRAAQGGRLLAPGRPDRPIQFIDVRDLATWIVRMLESEETGTYNTASAPGVFTMESLLQTCCDVSEKACELIWVDDGFLNENEVGAWMELPLWIPEDADIAVGFFDFMVNRAIAMGLTFRPLGETVRATMDWVLSREEDHEWRGGLRPEREAELLAAWLRRS
ncbi:NAD-dependent epimerase/dehydratase family protein [Candidatus Bipolaricaulota bacterium]|nr:NAD-dependent epimerase/dehydratase family protein [Candidatus Bipolaricaulota bacterium]